MRTAKKEKSIVSKQLIELRQSRGLTQEKLATQLGVTRDAIAYYETQAKNPSSELIQKLAEFFEVYPGTFIDDGKLKKTPGPTSKIERQLEAIRHLPKEKQMAVTTILDMALQNSKE